ncbi:MAG TPA: hypothetical protein VFD88_12790 [Clostridia bacterium]|nr:hypothetical protein [Clostridia bacterium]
MRQGALFTGLPMTWFPDELFVMRPKGETKMRKLAPVKAAEASPPVGGQEWVFLLAKMRPGLILSPASEVKSGFVRFLGFFSYNEGGSLARNRDRIERGEIPSAFHLSGDSALGVHEGALKLDRVPQIPRAVFEPAYGLNVREIATLDHGRMAQLLLHFQQYLILGP